MKNAPAAAAYASLRLKGEVVMDKANVQALRNLAKADGLAIVQMKLGRTNMVQAWLVKPEDRTTIVRPDAER